MKKHFPGSLFMSRRFRIKNSRSNSGPRNFSALLIRCPFAHYVYLSLSPVAFDLRVLLEPAELSGEATFHMQIPGSAKRTMLLPRTPSVFSGYSLINFRLASQIRPSLFVQKLPLRSFINIKPSLNKPNPHCIQQTKLFADYSRAPL